MDFLTSGANGQGLLSLLNGQQPGGMQPARSGTVAPPQPTARSMLTAQGEPSAQGTGGLSTRLPMGGVASGGTDWRQVLGDIAPALMMMDPLGRNNQAAAMMMRQNDLHRQDAKIDKNRNETREYLLSKGIDPGEADMLVNDQALLRQWFGESRKSQTPDWEIGTIYDSQGREQRIMYDQRDPSRYSALGGAKSDILSPEAEAQKARIAQAGRAETNVNVGAEKGYDKTLGEGYGKTFLGTQDAGRAARSALGTLDVMENAMSQPGFYSGAGGDRSLQLRRWGAALGFTDPDAIKDTESFNAMSKQAALNAMGGSLGTGFSNADRDFVIDQVPNLGNTPEGNAQLIGIQRKLHERKIQIAKKAREYAARNGGRIDFGFDDELAQWAESNPLFPPRPASSNGPQRVNNPNPPAGSHRTRAYNAQTGETLELDGGQWVPVR